MNNLSNMTIGVTTVAFSKNERLVASLNSIGAKEIKINPYLRRLSRDELIYFLKDCDGAIIGLDQINEEVLIDLPNLKFISKYGVGLDNIDRRACEKENCKILYSSGVNKRSVSEMTLGFMLSLQRNLYVSSNQLKEGKWEKNGGEQLSHKTIGILGLGNIGKDVVDLLSPFNCKILAHDILDFTDYCKEKKIQQVTFETLLKESDIITIHTPLTESTEKLFNKTTFNQMKDRSVLINTARGPIVCLSDLKIALKHKLKAAAIDVYDTEPPTDMELLSMPNLMNTPHIGGNAIEAVQAMGEASIKNIQEIFKL